MTIQSAAEMLGRHRVTLQDWLENYLTGRKESIPQWSQKALMKKPEGFASYGEIYQWLESQLGIKAKYKTLYYLVRYRLKVRPKVACAVSAEKFPEQVEAYKKTLAAI